MDKVFEFKSKFIYVALVNQQPVDQSASHKIT